MKNTAFGWIGTLARGVLVAFAIASAAFADDANASPADGRRIVVGEEYEAGGLHRRLWGDDYRALWTEPVQAQVLDLRTFAGGLTPVTRVGGRQTRGLALRGADGRDYTFRAVDKDPTSILPEELRDTWARDLVEDQIAASHPASFLIVDELMDAAGILHASQRLVVMPDDPGLGEFREDFAGLAGQLYEYAGGRSARGPGSHGAEEVIRHAELYRRLGADSREKVDARAFLKARLFDILIGDWDRHRDQWRWARFADRAGWIPIPDDRDQAFSRYEGLVISMARSRVPILQRYGASYPAMKGLTWNGREQDRQLLAGLEWPVWEEVASELESRITDDVIARAAGRMPPEYFRVDGARLVRDLTARRDRLPDAARAFYDHLADKVQVHLSDAAEIVEIRRHEGGDTLVDVRAARRDDGGAAGEPLFHRTLHASETSEVQLFVRGGDDRVTTLGHPGPIAVRVIGGSGRVVVDDTKGGGSRLSDTGSGEIHRGPSSRLDRRAYSPPPPPANAPWIPPRDWGRDTFFVPWLSYGSDLGAVLGGGIDTRAFGFRQDPFASHHVIRAAWAFGAGTFRADYRAEFRPENRSWSWGWYGYASGIEVTRYFGLGNDTGDLGDPRSDFFKARQQQYSLTPLVSFRLLPNLTLRTGPTVKYASTTHEQDDTLINQERPYGYGKFGEAGATALLELDTRDRDQNRGGAAVGSSGHPRSGVYAFVRGHVFPKAWDVEDTFGGVKGSIAAYLSPRSPKAPTLALRVGGEKVFGNYPYFEAAHLGGESGRLGALGPDNPLRGLQRQRFAGDAAVFGSADLRLYVSRFRFVLPGTWGVLGFADAGRVYLEGQTSDTWHSGYGGGLWFAWLDRANTITATYGRSEGNNAFYVRAGFAF